MKIDIQDIQNFIDREKMNGITTTMANIYGLKDVLEIWSFKLDEIDYRLANQDIRNFIEHLWCIYNKKKRYIPRWQMTSYDKVMEYAQYLRTSRLKVYQEDRILIYDLMAYFSHYYKEYLKEIQQ